MKFFQISNLGQGIGKHIDDPKKFGKWIISLTLGSGCEIVFSHKESGEIKKIYVDRKSVYKMKFDVRYIWMHQILPKKSDIIDKKSVPRKTRVSITFRKII